MYTIVYLSLLVFIYIDPYLLLFCLCLPLFTPVYLCLLVLVYLCLPMLTCVYPCLLVLTYVYTCLPMFTHVYSCLLMFTRVYICDPILENGAYCSIYDFELEHTKDEKVTLCRNSFYCITCFIKKYLSYDTKISPENFVAKKQPFLNIASFVHGIHHTEYDTGVYG